MTNGPESADAPRRSRRAAGSGAAAGAQERESQQRARDREALRAYKALTDSQPRPEPVSDANPPTRRQLRLAQQAAAQQSARRAALQQENPAPEASGEPETSAAAGTPDAAEASKAPNPAAPPQPGTRRERRRAAAAASAQPVTEASVQAASPKADQPKNQAKPEQAKREPAKPDQAKPDQAKRAPELPVAKAPIVQPVTPAPDRAPEVQERTARQGSAAERPNGSPQVKPADAEEPNADVANMSVEQALAAREALKHQARNQVAAMEALQQSDPHAVDLELLAQQRALAERAAVLNRRTQNIQRLAQENEQR
ncbi:MAG: hypothetical protein ABS909_07650, partial [Arthrobacter sp.]